MMIFTDGPDVLETVLEQRIRRVVKRRPTIAELPSRQAADAMRWGQAR